MRREWAPSNTLSVAPPPPRQWRYGDHLHRRRRRRTFRLNWTQHLGIVLRDYITDEPIYRIEGQRAVPLAGGDAIPLSEFRHDQSRHLR
jgi:hypothetical protein